METASSSAPDGVILTSAHVVGGASRVIVRLTSGREYKARVIGADKESDVAVLKIDARAPPDGQARDSNEINVGQWVIAIGSPYGIFNGGRLSETIGINPQIYSRSGGYQGLSFAIPIEVAEKVKDQVLAHGHVEHGRLGIAVQRVNQRLADAFQWKNTSGAVVSAVDPTDRRRRRGSSRAMSSWRSTGAVSAAPIRCRARSRSSRPARASSCVSGATARRSTSLRRSGACRRPARRPCDLFIHIVEA